MRVIEPYQLRQNKRKPKRTSRFISVLLVLLLITSAGLATWAYSRPLAPIVPNPISISSQGREATLAWPKYGQAAIGSASLGLLESSPAQKAKPTASVAKVVTSLAILKAKPIEPDQSGPTIVLTEADVKMYEEYVAKNGSVVAVKAGEKITERQALEAILLPSANNIADTMAIWAFGSLNEYYVYANKMVKELGMTDTAITSASGYSASTVSTANDLVKLGLAAMEHPVLSQIVSLKQSTLPVAGVVANRNILLGSNGVIGIKTGTTDEAGGCYLFASKQKFSNGKTETLVGVVMGAEDLAKAMKDSVGLIKAARPNFTSRTIVKKGDKLGYYDLPWGGQVTALAAEDLNVWSWKSQDLKAVIKLRNIEPAAKQATVVGQVDGTGDTIDAVLSSDVAQVPATWRLKRWIDG